MHNNKVLIMEEGMLNPSTIAYSLVQAIHIAQ